MEMFSVIFRSEMEFLEKFKKDSWRISHRKIIRRNRGKKVILKIYGSWSVSFRFHIRFLTDTSQDPSRNVLFLWTVPLCFKFRTLVIIRTLDFFIVLNRCKLLQFLNWMINSSMIQDLRIEKLWKYQFWPSESPLFEI